MESAPTPPSDRDIPTRQPVEWLWPSYIPRGKLTLLDGDPDVGKTFFTVDLAARLSRGGPLPDGQKLDRAFKTLFFSADDLFLDTILPRAEDAGAVREKLGGIDFQCGVEVTFPNDMYLLNKYVERRGFDLIVIDPISSYIPPAASGSELATRQALSSLVLFASKTGCSILLVRHLTKRGSPRSIYRGIGSIALTGMVRTGLLLARHPDDPDLRVLAQTKNNHGPRAPSLGFRIADGDGKPVLDWVGRMDLTADELCTMSEPAGKRPRERAMEWLKSELADGPRPSAELIAKGLAAGIAEKTLTRAKKDLRVCSLQLPNASGAVDWNWSLGPSKSLLHQSADGQMATLPRAEVAIWPSEPRTSIGPTARYDKSDPS